MDPLSDFLDGADGRTSGLVNTSLCAPWAVAGAGAADAALVAVVVAAGQAWCHTPEGESFAMVEGDVLLLHRTAFVLANEPRPPTDLPERQEDLRVSIRGDSPRGSTRLVLQTYDEPPQSVVLDELPPLVHLSAGSWECGLLPMLVAEATHVTPAQRSVLRRLLDLVLVDALREWCASSPARGQGWLRAAWDPVVGPALTLLHDDPAHPWTLHELAERVGSSRAGVASRFHMLVGQPPMAYLQQWRLSLATELLDDSDRTVVSVAREVGFADPFAFCSAFIRCHGVSPAQYRHRRATATAGA